VAALRSLRPVAIDVRVEASDARAASRTVTRRLVGDGVRMRRWRGPVPARLYLPEGDAACATVLVDATAGPLEAEVADLAAPLLASRGVLVLTVASGSIAAARDQLAAVPGVAGEVQVLRALDPLAEESLEPGSAVVLPPGVGVREVREEGARARALAWDALLAQLGAVRRASPE
jgi:hypothetical protein